MKQLILVALLLFAAHPAITKAQAVSPAALTKLSKSFDVSPDVLSKFKDMSLPDLQSGLDIAKKVSKKGNMSMNDAAGKVLGSKKGEKNWDLIAKDFGVEPPKPQKAKSLKQKKNSDG